MIGYKHVFAISLLAISSSAFAVPNVWNTGFAMGTLEYSIYDNQGRSLWIACDVGSGSDHSAWLETKTKTYRNDDAKSSLTFLLDGKKAVEAPDGSNWRGGANGWADFTTGMSKAKKIEVFVNNKKITTFMPIASSVKSVAKDIPQSCDSLLMRD